MPVIAGTSLSFSRPDDGSLIASYGAGKRGGVAIYDTAEIHSL
jgi:hypothetical protein